jgi:polysaccharide biosynthesis protein PslH
MKILFLSRWFPFPADNGSRLRIFNIIKILAKEHKVDLISFTSEPVSEERVKGLSPYCQKVEAVIYKDFDPMSPKSRLGYFSRWPRYIVDTYRREFKESVVSACLKTKYDLVVASQVDMTPYTQDIAGVKVLLDEMELAIHHEARFKPGSQLHKLKANLTWWKHSRYVAEVLERTDGISVVSEGERRLVAQLNKAVCRVEMIPNGVDMNYYQGDWGNPEPDTMIYAGALTYTANLDAMQYFIAEILPLIKEKRPKAKLLITGKVTDQIRSSLPMEANVEFTGYLEDVRPKIGTAWLSVIPLRIGGGTRLKILESLSMGTPVVSTSKGAEGLDLKPGRDILIQDTPGEFALEVIKVLEHEELRARLGAAGKQTVGSLYNWKLIGDRLLKFIDEIVFEK